MNVIIFDFEVFEYDILCGALVIDEKFNVNLWQSWDLEAIKKFYHLHEDDFWIGHNNLHYDDLILEAVVKGKNTKEVSDNIVEKNLKLKCKLNFASFDLMSTSYYSLKVTEASAGKNISESKVDFTLNRRLNDVEKKETESYNKDDLYQTYENFTDPSMFGYLYARLLLCNMFNLDISCINLSDSQIAAQVLKAKKIWGIEKKLVKPTMYPQLQLKNQALIDFYLNEDFRTNKKLKFMLCGCEHKCGSGGIHAALNKIHLAKAMYFDVSGYYNLVMLNYDLLPRTIDDESKEIYRYLYYKQLEYKKTAPMSRLAVKVVLLAVFGSMMNEYTEFYDPQRGLLVTITGQLFLVDLLEKLEGLIRVIQSNTDGIVVEPFDWNDYDKIINIVEEWEQRTGFVIKKDLIYDIHQRDVNCYFYHDAKGGFKCLGEAVNNYERWDKLFESNVYNSKEPPIMAQGIVDYFFYNKLPEQVVEEHKNQLRMFQYICRPHSFDYLEYEKVYNDNHVEVEKLQEVNRAFALNSCDYKGMVYKRKYEGKITKTKIACLPDSVFVYNNDIRDDNIIKQLQEKINYQYYVDRIYERIYEFIEHKDIKKIT